MANKKMKKPILKQLGSTYDRFYDTISSVFSSEIDIDIEDIKLIAQDETVFSGMNFLVSSIVSKIGDYSNPDEEIKNFINANFEDMTTSIQRRMEEMLFNAFKFGFSAPEKIWELKDGKVVLKDLAVYPSDTLTIEIENDEIRSVKQAGGSKGEVEIPPEKVAIFRLGQGVYGESYLKRCYKMWKFKQILYQLWAVGMEKYALPMIWVASSGDADDVSNKLANLWSKSSIVTDLDTQVQAINSSGNADFTMQFRRAIEYANYLIYRALNLPQLLLGTEKSGAYALGKVHFRMFDDITRSYARHITDVLVDQLVTQLINYNFPNAKTYGQFVITEEPNVDDRKILAQFAEILTKIGILNVDDENDVGYVRELCGIPDRVHRGKEGSNGSTQYPDKRNNVDKE
jgi:phage gp29-like protein